MSENEVKKQIMRLLNFYPNNIFCWRQNTAGVYNKPKDVYIFHGLKGVPDIIGMTDKGIFIGIEVKAEGKIKNQSEYQKSFQELCEKFGGIYILADNAETAENILKEKQIIK